MLWGRVFSLLFWLFSKTFRPDHQIILSISKVVKIPGKGRAGGIFWALGPLRELPLVTQWYILICIVQSIWSSRHLTCCPGLSRWLMHHLCPSPWHWAMTVRVKKNSGYPCIPECHGYQKAVIRPFVQVLTAALCTKPLTPNWSSKRAESLKVGWKSPSAAVSPSKCSLLFLFNLPNPLEPPSILGRML